MVYHGKEDTGLKVQLKRFYRWKYSGWIVIPFLITVIWFAYDASTKQIDYFEKFTCPMVESFSKGLKVEGHRITELDDSQQERFEAIKSECK
jgi:hypothetical protein